MDAALARGHEVTLFNRGQTNPELFPEVEKLRGDRDGGLDPLRGREWDAVVDVHGQVPRVVRSSAELLRDNVPHYTFVSTIAVYANFERAPSEDDPLSEDEPLDDEDLQYYAQRKTHCEHAVEEVYGRDALIVRPGLIVGPHDPTGRFTYWPHRIARDGDVLAPEPRDKRVQFIDVRDLGEWIVRMVEERASGAFNATGPEPRPTMEELLETCRAGLNPDARLVWADADFLVEHEVGQWMELPLWIVEPSHAGFLAADVSKAIARGLTFRPLEETIRAALEQAPVTDDAGMKPEREAELLAGWRSIAA